MATIWFVRERFPAQGNQVANRPFLWCVNELGLHRDLCLPTTSEARFIKRTANDSGPFGNPRHIFVELNDQERTGLSDKSWRSGYYLVLMPVVAVKNKLLEQLDATDNRVDIRTVDLSVKRDDATKRHR